MAKVNYYHSERQAADIGPEDGALHLCRACAGKLGNDVTWLSAGHDEAECEFCPATNDDARSAELDASFARITGKPAFRGNGVWQPTN